MVILRKLFASRFSLHPHLPLPTPPHNRYSIEDFHIVEVEKEFVGEIRNPDTGRQSQTFRIAGKVDAIVECHDGMVLTKFSELAGRLEELLDVTLELTKRTKGDYSNVYFNRRIQIPVVTSNRVDSIEPF